MGSAHTLSWPSEQAYAYSGGQAYAYSGGQAYTTAATPEAYGFAGFPGNPMLADAIVATRDALLAAVQPADPLGGADDIGAVRWSGTGMPPVADATRIDRYAPQVRAALVQLELQSTVAFAVDANGVARLWGTTGKSAPQLAELVRMSRPARAYLEGQLGRVDGWSGRRDVRAREVLTQVAPPLAYFASVLNLQAGRHRHSLELLNIALQFCYACCMHFKHNLAVPRPAELSSFMQAIVEAPMHPSLPAGHSAEAHVSATLLATLAGAAPNTKTDALLRQLAHRIGENRVIAGVHYPVDCVAGRLLGDAIASYLLSLAGRAGTWTGGEFAGASLAVAAGAHDDLDVASHDPLVRHQGIGCMPFVAQNAPKTAPAWSQLWTLAEQEWSA